MMSSRCLGQYKGDLCIIDEILIANLSSAKAPVTRMRFHNRLHRFLVNRR